MTVNEAKTKAKNNSNSIRNYRYLSILLAFFLALMIKFPLRIDLKERFYDALLYGIISLACIVLAIHIYQRFRKKAYSLIAIVLLCSILSGWQVFDLYVLRTGLYAMDWGPTSYYIGGLNEAYEGAAYYSVRFPNKNIYCQHVVAERYLGTYLLAITVDIKREASVGACGG